MPICPHWVASIEPAPVLFAPIGCPHWVASRNSSKNMIVTHSVADANQRSTRRLARERLFDIDPLPQLSVASGAVYVAAPDGLHEPPWAIAISARVS